MATTTKATKTTYVAARELTIDGKTIPAGTPILTAEAEIPIDRAINAVQIGLACTAEAFAGRDRVKVAEAERPPAGK